MRTSSSRSSTTWRSRQPRPRSRPPQLPLIPLRELEKRAIRRALDATEGNVSEAARLLGIGRATVYRRLAEMDDGRASNVA